MRSYMEGKKYRENKGESAIMEKMKKYIKFARGKIFFSFYALSCFSAFMDFTGF